MSDAVTLTVNNGLATMRIGRAHGNAINGELVEGLIEACGRAAADPDVRGVLFAASGKLFCPGLDLKELVELDRPALTHFVDRFATCVRDLYTFPKPLVAALHGHTVAGGCVLSLTADWRVLRRGAMVGLNEVRVGVPFPYGVAMIMRESVPASRLEEVAMFGWNYTDEKAVEVGLVHELHDEEGFETHCLDRLRELADKQPDAFAITKRYLRSPTVERLAADGRYAADFLESWFSPGTQQTIRSLVQQLEQRGG